MIRMFTWREEDLRRRFILAPYIFCLQFTCERLYLALALGSFARKVLVLGDKKKAEKKKKHKHGGPGRSAAKDGQFFLLFPLHW